MTSATLEQAAELEQWRCRFERGIPDATDFEMPWGSPMAVDLAIAEAVWHRLGSLFLEERDQSNTDTPWALRRFGQPKG